MTNPYRALCAELLGELQALRRAVADEIGCPSPEPSVVLRARAELAKPEPVAPTDEEILASVRHFYGDQTAADMGAEDDLRTARAVFARWDTPANALPTPEATNA